MPGVAIAMKKARDIATLFNKSTQATTKLKTVQMDSSLPEHNGIPKRVLQDVVTRWWSTFRMLKRLRFLKKALSIYDIEHDDDKFENLTPEEWKTCEQIEITLSTMATWQRVLEGENYVTGSLVPLAIFTIRKSFLQVIASDETVPNVRKLTKILLRDFDQRYHPKAGGKLSYVSTATVGFGNRYTGIHHYFFKAAFLDPRTHKGLKNMMTSDDLKQVCPSRLLHVKISDCAHHFFPSFIHSCRVTL